jgi:hypothetical protein
MDEQKKPPLNWKKPCFCVSSGGSLGKKYRLQHPMPEYFRTKIAPIGQ